MTAKKDPLLLPRMPFSTSSVNNTALRQGSGSKATKVLLKSVDIDLDVHVDILDQLRGSDSIDLQQTFFRDDKEKSPKDLNMGDFEYKTTFNDQIVIISQDMDGEVGVKEFDATKIQKFKATLRPGVHCKLHLQFQTKPQNDEDMAFLDKLLLDDGLYIQIKPGVQKDFTNPANDDDGGDPQQAAA